MKGESVKKDMSTGAEPEAGGAVLGIDLGSRSVKACLMSGDGALKKAAFETVSFYRRCGTRTDDGFVVDVGALGLGGADRIMATGYGRMAASLAGAENISELSAHTAGAVFQSGERDFTLLDMGGQDYKIVHVAAGRMVDMATNDKCAASTGRYLENMAAVLGISLGELGGHHENPADLSATCAIFGESELIGLLVAGIPTERLAAGVNRAVAERVLPVLGRMGDGPVLMSGGVALNEAVVRIVARETGRDVRVLSDPVFNGALGCCVRCDGM